MTVTKKHVKYRWVALGLLLAVLVTSFPLMALADGSSTLNALDITSDDRAYDWVTHGKTTYTYDFSATDITVYSKDEALRRKPFEECILQPISLIFTITRLLKRYMR